MKLRDLTDKQRRKFIRRMEEERAERNKGRKETDPLNKLSYNIGFSDGIRAVLDQIVSLP